MTTPLTLRKASPLEPGEFRFITKQMEIEPPSEPGGKRRFKTIASSTIVDMGGDEMKLSALEDMKIAFQRGLNIFTDHQHRVDKVFGRSDSAEIMDSGVRDEKTGAPIYDLHIAGVVNEPDPAMVQLADSIDGGYVTFGTSIGARVGEHKRNKSGGMDIYHVDAKEASLVGIPMNQRSWTYKAAKAAQALDEQEDAELEDDDEPEAEKAAPELAIEKTDDAAAEPETVEAATELTVDADVQESEPETPETTDAAENETDTSDAEKAMTFEATDVVTLALKARDLATAVTDRDEEIVTLKAERDRLATENGEMEQVIEKMLAMPLRAKTAIVTDLHKRLPDFLAPEVRNFLNKTAGDNQ